MSHDLREELREKLRAVERAALEAYRLAIESEGYAGAYAASCLTEATNAVRDALKGLEVIPS